MAAWRSPTVRLLPLPLPLPVRHDDVTHPHTLLTLHTPHLSPDPERARPAPLQEVVNLSPSESYSSSQFLQVLMSRTSLPLVSLTNHFTARNLSSFSSWQRVNILLGLVIVATCHLPSDTGWWYITGDVVLFYSLDTWSCLALSKHLMWWLVTCYTVLQHAHYLLLQENFPIIYVLIDSLTLC